MNAPIVVRVPATTANLGPGFDCLALALDLWNETTFTCAGSQIEITCAGEGSDLPLDERNMILQAMRFFCDTRGVVLPAGVRIECRNGIPVGSGLGSSAAAVLTGLLGAAALLNLPLLPEETLSLAARMEGHADNAAAALYGGLLVVAAGAQGWLTRCFDIPPVDTVIVFPAFQLSTHAARSALPQEIAMRDVTYNLGRAVLVVEALRTGDHDLLHQAIDDRLHLPYRLPLIPGAQNAMQAAIAAGASAVTISGAGPSLIAFTKHHPRQISAAMVGAFEQAGVLARAFSVATTSSGASVQLGSL